MDIKDDYFAGKWNNAQLYWSHKNSLPVFPPIPDTNLPPGKGASRYKKGGGARRSFIKGPLAGTKILFCGRGLKWKSEATQTETDSLIP